MRLNMRLINLVMSPIFGATLLVSIPFGATSPAPQRGGSVKIAMDNLGPGSFDPQESTTVYVDWITTHVFEGLLGLDDKGRPKPVLAASYRWSDDLKTLTFTLRKNVKFQNGDVMSAPDVVASLNRVGKRSAYIKSDWARLVSAVSAPDSNTIQITLKQP